MHSSQDHSEQFYTLWSYLISIAAILYKQELFHSLSLKGDLYL